MLDSFTMQPGRRSVNHQFIVFLPYSAEIQLRLKYVYALDELFESVLVLSFGFWYIFRDVQASFSSNPTVTLTQPPQKTSKSASAIGSTSGSTVVTSDAISRHDTRPTTGQQAKPSKYKDKKL